jgi:hypothetical protein
MAYSSLGLTSQVFELAKSRLDPKSPTKLMIVAITPLSLMKLPSLNEHLNQELNRDSEAIWLRLNFWETYENFRSSLNKLFPFKIKTKTPQTYYNQVFHKNGWIESWTEPENPNEAFESYRVQFRKDRFVEDIFEKLRSDFLKLQESGIEIVFFRMPSSPQMEALENEMGQFNYEELENLLTTTGAQPLKFNSFDFHSYDGSHLHKNSAIKFSLDLGLKINDLINATR